MKSLRHLFYLVAWLSVASCALAADWSEPANFLFSSHPGGTTVTVVDVRADRIAGTIRTAYPIADIAVSSFGDFAFASHAEERKVSVINLHSEQIERVVSTSVKPRHLTFEQNSGLVMTDSVDGGMAMLDPQGRREVFFNPDIPPSKDVIFGPTGIVAYYHSGTAGVVGAAEMSSGRALWKTRVPVSEQDIPLVRSLDGLFIVVVLPEQGEVQALMSSNGALIASQHLGKGLTRPYVTPNGQYFLVADPQNRQVHMLSQSNLSRLASISTSEPVTLVASGLFDIMAVGYAGATVFAIDLLKFSGKVSHELAVKGQASDVIVTSDSRHAYAAIPSADAIAHLNLHDGSLSYIEGIEHPEIVAIGAGSAVCH